MAKIKLLISECPGTLVDLKKAEYVGKVFFYDVRSEELDYIYYPHAIFVNHVGCLISNIDILKALKEEGICDKDDDSFNDLELERLLDSNKYSVRFVKRQQVIDYALKGEENKNVIKEN